MNDITRTSKEKVSEERLRNTRAWAAARLGQLSGAEVIVDAIDELLQMREDWATICKAAEDFAEDSEPCACLMDQNTGAIIVACSACSRGAPVRAVSAHEPCPARAAHEVPLINGSVVDGLEHLLRREADAAVEILPDGSVRAAQPPVDTCREPVPCAAQMALDAVSTKLSALSMALGNPALQWDDEGSIEFALIDEAIRRLSQPPASEPRPALRAPIDGPFEVWFKPKDGLRGVLDDRNGITLTVHGFVDDNEYRKYCEELANTLNAGASPQCAGCAEFVRMQHDVASRLGVDADTDAIDLHGRIYGALSSAPPPVPEWQPIETAPAVDGNPCIVAVPNYNNKTIKNPPMLVGEAHAVDGVWYWAGNDPTDSWGGPIDPTHWQPLPTWPCSTATKCEGQS